MPDRLPVALFTYNRPDHTRQALAALARCDGLDSCQVFIYCDGPKNPGAAAGVAASRAVVAEWADRLGAEVVTRDANLGLARSIVSGVSALCDQYGRVVVLEDDLVVNPGFLSCMRQGLDRYQDEPRVFQINGYMWPLPLAERPETFFLPLISTWGWATWDRAWRYFEMEPTGVQETLADASARQRFDLDGSYPFTAMLTDRLADKNDSWGILWWWQVFRQQGLALYPGQSLVWVGGADGTGTHVGQQDKPWFQGDYETIMQAILPDSLSFPQQIAVETRVYEQLKVSMKQASQPTVVFPGGKKARSRFKSVLRYLIKLWRRNFQEKV